MKSLRLLSKRLKDHRWRYRQLTRVFSPPDVRALLYRSRRARLVRLHIAEIQRSVYVRPGTSDLDVFLQVFAKREYECPFDIEPDFIIDAGANTGAASLFFAHKYPNARICALEPDDDNFQLLEKNCADVAAIFPIKAALWSHHAKLRIKDDSAAKWALSIEETDDPAAEIEAVTIPELMKRFGVTTTDLLKVDIEGGEKQVFSHGAGTWIASIRMIAIELHDWLAQGCSHAFYSTVVSRPFVQHQVGENLFLKFSDE